MEKVELTTFIMHSGSFWKSSAEPWAFETNLKGFYVPARGFTMEGKACLSGRASTFLVLILQGILFLALPERICLDLHLPFSVSHVSIPLCHSVLRPLLSQTLFCRLTG